MDGHVLPTAVLRDYEDSKHADERTNLSSEEIKQLTDMAAATTPARATRKWNKSHPEAKVAERTAGRYLQHWKQHKKYYTTSRGRAEFSTAAEDAALVEACNVLRRAGKTISAEDACNIMIGMIDRDKERRGLLAVNGGPALFSASWGRSWLHRHNFSKRHATTDRVISPDQVRQDGTVFRQVLKNIKERRIIDKRLCFNMDEFFVQLDHNRNWTWTRVVHGQPISISANKLGFTMSITTTAYEVVLVQIIWRGKTSSVHVEAAPHDIVHQMHREDSHFQNSDTFAQWSALLLNKISVIRERDQVPEDVTPVLILDQAPQHTGVNDARWRSLIHVAIPKKQTHIWQPADQWIIACFKKFLKGCWKGYLQQVFRNNELNDAIKELLMTSLPVLRARKHAFILEALTRIQPDTLYSSWERTGILRELFDIPVRAGKVVVYDTFIDATDVVEVPPTDDDEEAEPINLPLPLNPSIDFILVATQEEAAQPKRGRPKKQVQAPKVAAISVLQMLSRKRQRPLEDID